MKMQALAKSHIATTRGNSSLARVCTLLLFCLAGISHAHAGATLLLEEPYSYDGALAGTGHVAVYLSNVCASSPVVLRRCAEGESGVVLSRYDAISGYDWIAVPLIPYLYAVDSAQSVPLFADAKLVAFLRDQYRRDHLESVAPDLLDGSPPAGNWYELVGSAYDRTIYGFEIETTPEQDALLIDRLNSRPNIQLYNFVKRNCADFVREVIDIYYPHAVHRSLIGDLGVTTPKQIAKMLVKYSHHHPELQSANFLVPQVPGAERRSKPIHGVLESVIAAKKYMLPLVALHPYIGGGLLVEYFGHRRFDPSRNAPVLDAGNDLDLLRLDPSHFDSPMTRDQRLAFASRMDEMSLNSFLLEPPSEGKGKGKDVKAKDAKTKDLKTWERLEASAEPALDKSGQPILQLHMGDDSAEVGLSRSNILSASESPEFAVRLLQARLLQELRPAIARKTSPGDVQKDLTLFRQLLSQQQDSATHPSAAQAQAGLQ
jgi:hypothetical protein